MSEIINSFFTNPAMPNPENHVTECLKLIKGTARGEKIYIVMSTLNILSVSNALIDRAKKGVIVKIILEHTFDAAQGTWTNQDAINLFNSANCSNLELITCNGCYGHLHMKLLLISNSKVKSAVLKNVVVAGSFTFSGYSQKIHQSGIMIQDEFLYKHLMNYWELMKTRNHPGVLNNAIISDKDYYSSTQKTKAYLWPRSSDAIVNIINNMSVKTHNGKKPMLRIAISRWSSSNRGKKILEAIIGKMKEGLVVQVVSRAETSEGIELPISFPLALNILLEGNDNSLHLGKTGDGNGKINIHHKYFTYEGFYNDSSDWKKIVWTGSENWTYPALAENDEILIKCENNDLYAEYISNHKKMKSYCTEVTISHTTDIAVFFSRYY